MNTANLSVIAERLLGKPRHATRGEWRYGNKGSLSLDTNKGVWFSHETGEGGDAIDLVRWHRKCGFRDALDWLNGIGEIPAPSPPQERAAKPDNRAAAVRIWGASGPIGGTLGERYLTGRGLPGPYPKALRFHRACPFAGETPPAMVAAMRDYATGDVMAVHRTALAPDAAKRDRKMLGPSSTACIMLVPFHGGRLGVCEGVETGLAVLALGWPHALWSLASAGKIARFPVIAGVEELTIFADHDVRTQFQPHHGGEGVAAALKSAEHYRRHNRRATMVIPEREGDWVDILTGSAT